MRWLRGLSIRARLTIGTLIVALVVAVATGVLLRVNVESIVRATTVQLLQDDAAPLEAAIRKDPTKPALNTGEGQLVLVLMPSGAVALTNLPDALEDKQAHIEALGDDPQVITNDGKSFLVRGENVHTDAGNWKIFVARSLEPGDLVIARLDLTYLIGAIALFVLLGAASWVLSGAALRPVGRMRREAQRLGDATAPGSLPVGPARDELAALASTLNEFIDRNRTSVERERQMISDASHELRTPLAILIAQLDAAAAPNSRAEDREERLRQARDTSHRLSRLATNLLELSKLDAPRVAARSDWTQLSNEFARCIDNARVLADERGVLVDFDVAERTGAGSFGIPVSDFGRLIDNILSNAVAASPSNAEILAVLTQGDSGLVAEVRDQGPGMPEDFIPVAFDRFTRPEDARSRASGGSGLGLAIVSAIASAAGGFVTITNAHPGLLVRLDLPND